MHILIIPSEEFVPAHNHALGIFQLHQANILQEANHTVGVLSITQAFSIPMLLKAILYRCIGKEVGNATDTLNIKNMIWLLWDKIFSIKSFLIPDIVNNIPVYRIVGFYYGPPSDVNNKFGWIKAGMAAFEAYVLKHGKPDIVHAHNAMYAGMLAQEIKTRYNIPYVITEHSTAFARNLILNNKIKKWIQEAYTHAHSVYAVSKSFCQLLGNRFEGIDFLYLPNVLDPYLETAVYDPVDDKSEEYIFLNIAELHAKKNQKLLIKAFKQVKLKHTNAKLWIAGKGDMHEELLTYIGDCGLEKEVFLLGSLDRPQVLRTIKQADCMVLSSNYETFGVVLIEGMLFGKPVIATCCGGPESFIDDTTGILVDKNDSQGLSIAMAQMIENQSVYNAGYIRKYTIDHFGKKCFLHKIEQIYNAAISA